MNPATILAVVVVSWVSQVSPHPTPQASDRYVYEIARSDGRLVAVCRTGCAWSTLSFTPRAGLPFAFSINSRGVGSPPTAGEGLVLRPHTDMRQVEFICEAPTCVLRFCPDSEPACVRNLKDGERTVGTLPATVSLAHETVPPGMERSEFVRCPVHDCCLVPVETTVHYGLPGGRPSSPAIEPIWEAWDQECATARRRLFPYACIEMSGGCVVFPDSPRTGRQWCCPVCNEVEAWFFSVNRPPFGY